MTSDGDHRAGRGAFLLVLILLIGVWHGWGLGRRGLMEHDEGHNLLAARTYREVLAWGVKGGPFRSNPAEIARIRDELHRQGGTLYPAGKPGYVVLLALSSFVTGLGQNPALRLSWLGGMLCVALVPGLLREWSRLPGRDTGSSAEGAAGGMAEDGQRDARMGATEGGRSGVVSATGVAVAMIGVGFSPLIGSLSREVGGVIWSLFFGLLGLWLLLSAGGGGDARECRGRAGTKGRRGRAFLAGLSLGLGFTCHYNLLPLLVAVFAADLAREGAWKVFSEERGKTGIGACGTGRLVRSLGPRWGLAIAGGMTVFLVFQTGTWLAERRLRSVYPEYENYASELIRIVRTFQVPALEGGSVGEGTRGWGAAAWSYAGRVAWREGPVALAVAVAALFFAGHQVFRRRRLDLVSPLLFLMVPFVFWILHPWKVERSWAMIVAAAALLAGCVFSGAGRARRTGRGDEGEDSASGKSGWKTSGAPDWRGRGGVIWGVALVHVVWVGVACWPGLWTQRSPIPETVRRTLAHVSEKGGSIQANSAARSFAPLWKWAVVEEGRREEMRPAMKLVDFSAFGRPDIVFVDPRSWLDPDFPASREEIDQAKTITEMESKNPAWRVASYDLRESRNEKRRAR